MSNDEFPYGACPECGCTDDDIEPSDPEDLAEPPWLASECETTEDSQARNGEW